MKATMCEVLVLAEKNGYAIGAFNTPNLECLLAVLHNAERMDVPVIISHAQLHEPVAHLDEIGPVMAVLAEKARVPVCVHLDHGESLDYLKHALDLGFTSVMYDGSLLSYEENVENTKKVMRMAEKAGASVEAEIGVMAGRESEANPTGENSERFYTDPALAKRFADETKIHALACSFGTVHGIYKEKPRIDFDRIEKIRTLTGLPLVMHGGSGVSPQDYREAIRRGVRKINYYTYMSRAAVQAVRDFLSDETVIFYHDAAMAAQKAMEEDVYKAMGIFYERNHTVLESKRHCVGLTKSGEEKSEF